MCGICGYVGIHEPGLLRSMTEAIAHRGPDGQGCFAEEGIGLGHRRLSIIDVAGGQQPIFNEDRSVVLIANGEIYNHRELRSELEAKGHRFRSRSDSEVLVHLYEEEGPEGVRRLGGMYAYAIYDTRDRSLFLARDRLGIKPLYYADLPGGRFLFASESKSILRYGGLRPTLDPRAVHDYLALRYVPGPGGMIAEIRKLPAAHWARYRDGRLELRRYWQPELYEGPFPYRDEEYLEGFAQRFEMSVERRLMSEVPFGAYLSGGLDSSVIVAAMAARVSTPVRTFAVGFDYAHDELAAASETARLLGCEHTEIACTIDDIELLPDLVYHLDEPLGDPIVIPMHRLARTAKSHVTVIQAGEGADEILGGYLFHKALLGGCRLNRAVPGFIRRGLLGPALRATPARVLNLAFSYPAALGGRGKQKLLDYLDLTGADRLPEAYRHLISLFDARDVEALYANEFERALGDAPPHELASPDGAAPYLNRILHLQFAHWLPDDILMKQDKMSMASGVEVRVPFLDHELVEYVLRVPPRLKIRGLTSKHLLRRYASRVLPDRIVRRRKMPFYLPLEKYARHPTFLAFVDETLSEKTVRERGLFRPAGVQALRDRAVGGEFVYVKQLFSLVVLELWMRGVFDRSGRTGARRAG